MSLQEIRAVFVSFFTSCRNAYEAFTKLTGGGGVRGLVTFAVKGAGSKMAPKLVT